MGLLDYLWSLLTGEPQASPGPGRPVGQARTSVRTEGAFRPARPVTIQYRNFEGRGKAFVAEGDSITRKGNHLVGRFAPTGRTMTLSRDRIENLRDVESVLLQRLAPGQQPPTPRERQVLGYHKKHRTSSPLFEKIRARYPNW